MPVVLNNKVEVVHAGKWDSMTHKFKHRRGLPKANVTKGRFQLLKHKVHDVADPKVLGAVPDGCIPAPHQLAQVQLLLSKTCQSL